MANYIKIKRVKSTQSHIATAVEGNWTLEEWKDIEKVEREIEKMKKEAKGRLDEDNTLKSKTTRDRHLLLQPIKRLEAHLSCKGGFQE